jgi:hypothetical protein
MKIKKLSKKQIIIIIVVAVLVLALIVPSGVYMIRHDENPVQMMQDLTTPDDEQIVAKWQGEKAANGYEFFDDGTYQSYISTFSYDGEYEIDGNRLILTNPESDGKVIYRFSVNGEHLNLTLIESNGEEPEVKEKHTFTKVEHFNMKSPLDILRDFVDEANKSETQDSQD